MIFSNAAEYGIRALSELAARNAERPVLLDDLLAGTELPRGFVAKIFQTLVRSGILRSNKGRGGGFTLARPQQQIALMQIVEAIDGPQRLDACVIGLDRCNDRMACSQHDLYKPIRQQLKDYLMKTTLADMAVSLRSKQAWRKARSEPAARGTTLETV